MARMVVEEVMAMADIVERGERGGEVEETEGEVTILTVGVMASLMREHAFRKVFWIQKATPDSSCPSYCSLGAVEGRH